MHWSQRIISSKVENWGYHRNLTRRSQVTWNGKYISLIIFKLQKRAWKETRTFIYTCFSFLANENIIKLVLGTFSSFSHHPMSICHIPKSFFFFFLVLVRIWIDIGWNLFIPLHLYILILIFYLSDKDNQICWGIEPVFKGQKNSPFSISPFMCVRK